MVDAMGMMLEGKIKHINSLAKVRGRSPQPNKGTGSNPVLTANI